MIGRITINNYRVFASDSTLSLMANMSTKRLASNVMSFDNVNILKSVGIYGSNNTGKTSFVNAVRTIKNIMLGSQTIDRSPNMFTKSPIMSFSIQFMNQNSDAGWLDYSVSFDAAKNYYAFEKLTSLSKDKYGNRKETVRFIRDYINQVFSLFNENNSEHLRIVSSSIPVLYGLSSLVDEDVKKYRKEFEDAARSIEIVELFNIPIEKTIEILKNGDETEKKLITDFVKSADLSIEDFKYDSNLKIDVKVHPQNEEKAPDNVQEDVLKMRVALIDQAHLVSVYGGKQVRSLFFDSSGTKKIQALSSYIIEALRDGKTLIIDELDSGLHFKITRGLVSLFNNIMNKRGQLIFTTHDVTLLDTKFLMRKEQINFIDKANGEAKIYPLSKYTAREGTRETSDLIKHYNRGDFGYVPEPSFINSLFSLVLKSKGRKNGKDNTHNM